MYKKIKQGLVTTLRTIWYEISSFDVEKTGQFLNPQPAFCSHLDIKL